MRLHKKLSNLFLVAAVVLAFSLPGFSQTAVSTTTLSAAITSTSGQTVVVASASGINAPSTTDPSKSTVLLVDRELMQVTAVNSTTLKVIRGYGGTRAATHSNSSTVYVGPYSGVNIFLAYAKTGSCTATNELYLPQVVTSISSPGQGSILDCFGSQWQFDDNLPRYKFTLAPNAQRSATSPTAGSALSLTVQAGGAQSATTGNGANGGAAAITGGIGGAGGTSSGTAGAGGAVSLIGGAGGGTVTGGAGGLASVGGGAGGNGSTAGGSGGGLNLYSGAKGTGGTGTDGAINIRQGGAAATANFAVSTAGGVSLVSVGTNQSVTLTPSGSGVIKMTGGTDPTKIVAIDASGNATGLTDTLAFSASSSGKTHTFPNSTGTVSQQTNAPCASASASCTETPTSAGKTISGISGALNGASPSVAVVTFSTGFTSSSSYTCVASPNGNSAAIAAGGVAITYTSATQVTFTSANALTNAISFICTGT